MKCIFSLIIIITIFFSYNCSSNKTVHVVFSNHLDMGYLSPYYNIANPPFTSEIVNLYFKIHFPDLLRTIDKLSSYNIKYVFTTHGYLVYAFIHCEKDLLQGISCPDLDIVNNFRQAIVNGNIVWTALPFNIHSEMNNKFMLEQQIKLIQSLDREFNLTYKTVLSQRDIPGLTASVIPILNKHGIKYLSVGVNQMSASPQVPKLFKWYYPLNNSSVVAIWHPGGYGNYFGDSCVEVDYQILCYYYRSDNEGSGDYKEVIKVLEDIKNMYPDYVVDPSSFDNFFNNLNSKTINNLPIIKSEIGDTWNHALSTDPAKVQIYRHIIKFLQNNQNKLDFNNKIIKRFIFRLLKISEHTCGLDEKTYLHDNENWDNNNFYNNINNYNYQTMVTGWNEQRNFLSINLMKQHPVLLKLYNEIVNLDKLNNYNNNIINKNIKLNKLYSCNNWQISFGVNGNINYLGYRNKSVFNNIYFSHQTLDSTDVNNYIRDYSRCGDNCPWWFVQDFGKVGIDKVKTCSGIFKLNTIKVSWLNNSCKFIVSAKQNSTSIISKLYSSTDAVSILVDLSDNVKISLMVNNKTATRLPEAYWLSFNLTNNYYDINNWYVHKINNLVPVNNVVKNGSMHLHGTMNGVYYKNNLNITPIDSNLVSFDVQSPYPTPFSKNISIRNGIHFLLYNNVWGTNYPSWYPFNNEDRNLLFRFKININNNNINNINN